MRNDGGKFYQAIFVLTLWPVLLLGVVACTAESTSIPKPFITYYAQPITLGPASEVPTNMPTQDFVTNSAILTPPRLSNTDAETKTMPDSGTALITKEIKPAQKPAPRPVLIVTPVLSAAPSSPRNLTGDGVREETLAINSYNWREALIPSLSNDVIYPYPRMDFGKLTGVSAIKLKVVILENAYARVTVAPELGGRILHWYDKRIGHDVLYSNSVLKPTHWGIRGWWLATGGIEFTFPTEEHGLNEWRPWRYTVTTTDAASITVFDHEDKTGLDVAVTIRLAVDGTIIISPKITNNTGSIRAFQFWTNAMLPYSPDARFEVFSESALLHSTDDTSFPPPYQSITWPVFRGRDFSRASEWRNYMGLFMSNKQGHTSIYYPNKWRITRLADPSISKGVKLFLLGDLSPSLYTDDGSRYLEIWGGLTETFRDNYLLVSGKQVSWTETWKITVE